MAYRRRFQNRTFQNCSNTSSSSVPTATSSCTFQGTPTIPTDNYYSSGQYFRDIQESLSNGNSSSTPTATSSTHSSLNFSDTNRPQLGTSYSSSLLSRLNPFNFFSRNSADSGKNDSLKDDDSGKNDSMKDDDSKDNSNDSIFGNSSGNLISVHNSDGITFFAPDDIPDYLNGGDVYSYEDFSCGDNKI